MSIPAHLLLDRSVSYFYFRTMVEEIVYMNDNFDNHLSHIQPKHLTDFITIEQDVDNVRKTLKKAQTTPTYPVVCYFRVRQKNGASRWMLWEVFESDSTYHFIGAPLYDVVSIKSYEYDQIRNLLETIAWEWSHRTRRPLTSVIGLARFLDKNETMSNEDREAISMLLSSAKELDEVIEQLTDILSRNLPEREN
jgi:signal transduction histidine kinase